MKDPLEEGRRVFQLWDLLDLLPVPISYIDVGERYRFANAAYREWFNLEPNELCGRTVRETIGEDAYSVAQPHLAKALSGESVTFENASRGRDFLIKLIPGRSPDGAVGGVYAFIIEITEQKRADRRLDAIHAVTHVLVQARSFDEAAPRVLEALCTSLNLAICELWMPDPQHRHLFCIWLYAMPDLPGTEELRRINLQMRFGPGQGLPGRVWKTQQPAWITDVATDPTFLRRQAVSGLGLCTAYAFPILTCNGCGGVVTLFSRHRILPDLPLLEMAAVIGRHIGDLMQRMQAEEQARFLAVIVEASEDAILSATVDGVVTSWNPAAEQLFGFSAQEAVGARINLVIPEDRLEERNDYAAKLDRGERVKIFETERLTKSGKRVPVSLSVSGIRDAIGNVVGIAAIARDISDRKRFEAELQARLQQQQAIAELGQGALRREGFQVLADDAVKLAAKCLNVEFCNVLELLPDKKALLLKAGVGWKPGLVGHATVGAGLDSQAGYTLASDRPVIVPDLISETRFSPSPLLVEHGIVSGVSVIIGNRPYGVLAAHTSRPREFTDYDVYFLQSVANILAAAIERREAADRQQLLQHELSHRVKNTLSVVQALARQSGKQAKTVEAFRSDFDGRLRALLAVHNLLAQGEWQAVHLSALAHAVLAPHSGGGRICCEFEDLPLDPSAAQSLALALHELASNASKYGALSMSEGRVSVRGHIHRHADGGKLELVWQEAGGPSVRPPAHSGFGSSLLKRIFEHQHSGEVQFDWQPRGLVYRLTLPLAEITKNFQDA